MNPTNMIRYLAIVSISVIAVVVIARLIQNRRKKRFLKQTTQGTNAPSLKPIQQLPNSQNEEIIDDQLKAVLVQDALQAIQEERESLNPKFHRTAKERELSFQFSIKHGSQMSRHEQAFENAYRLGAKAESMGYQEKALEKYNEAIRLFDEAQSYAYHFGKGGQIYFDDMWNHLHNSRNPDFSWRSLVQANIHNIVKERDYFIPEIKRIITENPGILQKDIYRYFNSEDKSRIQSIIRKLEDESVLSRTKKSNSYELHILSES